MLKMPFFLIKKYHSDLPLPQPYRLCGFYPTEIHTQQQEYSPTSYLSKMHSESVSVGADLVQMSLELVWEIRVHFPSHCDLQAVTPAWSQPLVSLHHTDTKKPCNSCCWGQLVWKLMHVQFSQEPSLRVLVTENKAELPWKSDEWLALGQAT